jgi:PAS domain-containing protein
MADHERQVLETGRARFVEEVIQRGNDKRTYLTVIFPLKDTEGLAYGLCSIATDITERKQMETLLRESEQRLQAIISSIGEGVVVSDTNMNFIVFNPIAEEILGFGAVEIPVTEWASRYGTFRPDKVTPFPSEELPLFRALKGESADEVEIFIRNQVFPEGKFICVTGRPIRNNQKEIIGSVVVFRDISAMKHMEELILENEKRLKTIISSIGEGIVVADTTGKFVLFNKKAEELLGMGAAPIPVTEWSARYGVFRPDKQTPFPPGELPLARALKGESTQAVELFIRNANFPDGRTISVSGRPITDEQGNITASVVDFRDVTEMKKLEETLAEIKAKYQLIISKSAKDRKEGPDENSQN